MSKTTWMHICEGSHISLDAHYSQVLLRYCYFNMKQHIQRPLSQGIVVMYNNPT